MPAVQPPVLSASFIAQDQRPDTVEEIDLASLAPYHRTLIVNDGTTSSLLRAWRGEPTVVKMLTQGRLSSPSALLPWLEPKDDDTVLHRRATILSCASKAPLVAAESLWVPGRLSAAIRSLLTHVTHGGIGAALTASKAEIRRELLWYGRTEGAVASRAYRIITSGVPVFVVQEDFTR
jgi:chorismate-pyruvate lyase